MALNEARGLRGTRHSLTPQQRTEQLAAVYGLEPETLEMESLANFSPEQVEQMRAMLAAHDATQPREGIKSFDLNNPPKLPYAYKEYPRCMYHHSKRITKNAHNDAQVASMEADGWTKEPFLPEGHEAPAIKSPVDTELDANGAEEIAAEAEEIAAVDAIAKKKKKAA